VVYYEDGFFRLVPFVKIIVDEHEKLSDAVA
jgi:hypothetical protein